MAGLWLRPVTRIMALSHRTLGFTAVALAGFILAGCSELATGSVAAAPATQPDYVPIAASYLRGVLKDRTFFEDFRISGLRWVDTIKGWNWLACVQFQDHGHLRRYAIFIQGDAVVDARYAVETDGCQAQAYTQFDLVTGALGRPTALQQPALY